MTHTASPPGPTRPSGQVHCARFVVLVIAKAPIAGRAKTRLSPPAQDGQAADIAAAALLDTLDTVRSMPDAQPVVALAGDLDDARRSNELASALDGLPVIDQGDGDLGTRLARTLGQSARLYPGLGAVLIGMDTPQVSADLLTAAAEDMSRQGIDGVLGPARDGGWWLLGMRDPGHRPALRALGKTPMSLPDTGDRTLHALKGAGLSLSTTVEISDVDTMADARAVAAEVPGSRFAEAVAAVRDVS